MGVRGIQTFLEMSCPTECCSEVSIEKLANEYREETGSEPVIVVDGSSVIYFLYDGLDWVSGGQYKELVERIENFLNAFQQLGIHLVFFFDGCLLVRKRNEWIQRCVERLDRNNKFFNKLSSGTRTDKLNPFWTPLPPGACMLFQRYLQYVFGCEVYQCVDEGDTEIACYAREHKCMAIFAQDADYIILEGGSYYLSAQHFDLSQMKTISYDRQKFADILGLQPSQLPLLATLAGNDLVSHTDLKPFHASICEIPLEKQYDVYYKALFSAIAEFIKPYPTGNALVEFLPEIAEKALNDPDAATILETSIDSYISSSISKCSPIPDHSTWNAIIERAEELHRKGVNSSVVITILNGESFEGGTTFEDLRLTDLPPTLSLLRPMRRRIYGILLHEKPVSLGPRYVTEWCMEGPDSMNEPKQVDPITPSDPHPGLLALWYDDRSCTCKLQEDLQNTRWRLFAHAISPSLDPTVLRTLPEELIVHTALLFYIVESNILETWEVEALIATIVMIPSTRTKVLADLPSDPVNIRAVRIATVYMRTLWHIFILLSACGFPIPHTKVFQYPYFEGKLFQQKYKKAERKVSHAILCGLRAPSLALFQQVRAILFIDPATSGG